MKKIDIITRRRTIFSVLFSLIILIAACGNETDNVGNSGKSAYGAISVSLKLGRQGNTRANSRQMMTLETNCIIAGVDTVTAEVYDERNELLKSAGPWPCSAGHGLIEQVNAGNNRKVVVLCWDAEGNVTHRGEKTDVTVFGGRTSGDIVIKVLPVSGPASNSAPIADSGTNQTVNLYDVVFLDGSGSSDADSDTLTYAWRLIPPQGSNAVLSDAAGVRPSFIVDVPGDYIAELIVSDSVTNSQPSITIISTLNTPPVAEAGPAQTAAIGDTVVLDGTGSSDADGDRLSFQWEFTALPGGSNSVLSDTQSPKPTFEVDSEGTYEVQLVVESGQTTSDPDTVTIVTDNSPPAANAGYDIAAQQGSVVKLNGTLSHDMDGNPLSYSWAILSLPNGSTATLDNNASPVPSFFVDQEGDYTIQLIVNDGSTDSLPDAVTVSTVNSMPVAVAGQNQSAIVNDVINLDGSGSYDPDGEPLDYLWSLIFKPQGSAAVVSEPLAAQQDLSIDVDGTYIVQLTVYDGVLRSQPDTVTISTINSPPVAYAGEDQYAGLNDTIQLDAEQSDDPDNDTLTYDWAILFQPQGDDATLSDTTNPTPSFLADMSGMYIIQLIVNDGQENSMPDTVAIFTENVPPIANAGADQTVFLGEPIQLDGSASFDPNNESIFYTWSAPQGSDITFSDPNVVNPELTVDLPGTYEIELEVRDGAGETDTDTCVITVVEAVVVSISESVSMSEGDTGTSSMIFTVTLSSAINRDVSVAYETVSGTAVEGVDFTETAGTVVFQALSTTPQEIMVPVIGETEFEEDEVFYVNLSNPVNAIIGNAQGIGTILNDDVPKLINLNPSAVTLFQGESETITVMLSDPAGSNGVVVQLSSSNENIASISPQTITIPEGGTSGTFEVTAGYASGSAEITASADGHTDGGCTVTITAQDMMISLNNSLVGVGSTLGGSVILADPAPSGGITVTLDVEDSNIASISETTVIIPEGEISALIQIYGIASGETNITATVVGFAQASALVTVTSAQISFGDIPEIAPGQTNSLPMSLGVPAPAGGVTVFFTTSDSDVATVTASVFIPEGHSVPDVNPQVTGVQIGETQITALADGFASAVRDVTVTIDLNFSSQTLTVIEEDINTITLTLSAPAPADGLLVNLGMDNTGVATVPDTAFISAGQTSVVITVTGVEPGDTILRANVPGATEATATINVTEAPNIIVSSDLRVGKNLQLAFTNAYLETQAPAGNVMVTITSSEPTRLLVAESDTEVGTQSITRQVNAGSTTIPRFYLQALDDSGTVEVTFTAPGYQSGVSSISLRPSGFAFYNSYGISTTTFASPTNRYIYSWMLDENTLNTRSYQSLRAGISVELPLFSENSDVGMVPDSVTISGGTYYATVPFTPVNDGTTTIGFVQPQDYSIPSNRVSEIEATVTAPEITFSDISVGRNLQQAGNVYLGAAPPDPVNVSLEVVSPDIARISLDASTDGSGGITFEADSTSYGATVYVQGISEGTTAITISAEGYQTKEAELTVTKSGFAFYSVGDINTNIFSNPTNRYLYAWRLNDALNVVTYQTLRPGVSVEVQLTNDDDGVGTVPGSVTFASGEYYKTVDFTPLSAGETTFSITQPSGYDIPANRASSINAVVTASEIYCYDSLVGKDLQVQSYVYLSDTPPSPTDIVLEVEDSAIALISTDPLVEGASSITLSDVDSTQANYIYVQGISEGQATVTVTAEGYQDNAFSVTVLQSGFGFYYSYEIQTTTFSAPTNRSVNAYALQEGTLNIYNYQSIRGGVTKELEISNSDPTVGSVPETIVLNANQHFANISFTPASVGSTEISISQPDGHFEPANRATIISAEVTAPGITIHNSNIQKYTIGEDLQVYTYVYLNEMPPNPVDVTVTVSSSDIARLSKDPESEGTESITFEDVEYSSANEFYVQGFLTGDTILTVQAAGYSDATMDITVIPSGFGFSDENDININVSAENLLVWVYSIALDPTTLNFYDRQQLRGGLTVEVPVTISDSSVGDIVDSPATFTGGDVTSFIYLDPVAVGSATINITTPGGFDVPSNCQEKTVNVTD